MDPARPLLSERRTGRADGLMAPDHGVVAARGGGLLLAAQNGKKGGLENPLYVAMVLGVPILPVNMISVELGVTGAGVALTAILPAPVAQRCFIPSEAADGEKA